MDYKQQLEDIREENFDRDEENRRKIHEWKNMPAYQTASDIETIKKHYKNRTLKAQAKIVLRVNIPDYEFKFSWCCYLELYIGNEMQYQIYASSEYCESIFEDKSWKKEIVNGISFFTQNIEHKIKEKKQKLTNDTR